jgi:hypothetical protein
MKISGFTIARNAVKFGYPLAESLRSLLPLVDELVVAVGDCEDGTWELVDSLADPKVKAFRTVWDPGALRGGEVLSQQSNLALRRCQGDWAVYLQADEVLHEEDMDLCRRSMRRHLEARTEGLSFRYLHFYGSYATIQDNPRKWYRRAVRAVKTGLGIESVGDAFGFRRRMGDSLLSLRKADSGARVFHYGWVRPPEVMLEKQKNLDRLYHDEAWIARRYSQEEGRVGDFYRDRGHLKFFRGSHPSAMAQRVRSQDWTFEHGIGSQWPSWLRHLYLASVYPVLKRMRRLKGA